jgi:hypothetical protein
VKPLSIEESFLWAQRFAAREWRLLLPVAFAFLAVPPLVSDMIIPPTAWAPLTSAPMGDLAPLYAAMHWLLPLFLVITLFASAGGLAITALALVPRISVREAIALALQRVLVLIAALLLVAVAELVVTTLAGVLFTLIRPDPVAVQSLLVGVLLGVSLVITVRLMTLMPVVASARTGPIAAIMTSWELTRGAFWRIFAAVVGYAVGGMIVVFASATAAGAVLLIVGRLAGSAELGTVLAAVFLRATLALFWTGFHLLVVALYRQLGGTIRGM